MNFIARFFLLVLLLSVSELYLLIELATRFSLFFTLALCVFTGVVGGSMVRAQGLTTLQEIGKHTSMGKLPGESIISGLILLSIGTMLLTPGFITDIVAFLMLFPPLRRLAAKGLMVYFKKKIASGVISFSQTGGFQGGPRQAPRDGPRPRNEDIVIEVDPEE